MARRLSVLSVVALMLLALAVPTTAGASAGYRVKDRSGHVVGTIGSVSGIVYAVRGASGARVGTLEVGSSSVCAIHRGGISGTVIAWSYGSLLHPKNLQKVIGKAFRAGSDWVIKKRIHGAYRKMGTVPASCYSGLALGAVRLLAW